MSRRSAFLASALVVPIVLAMSFADRLVYFPVGPHDATPTALGLAYEDVHLQASDGVAIHAWFVPAEESAATPRAVAQRPAVLFLHGNAGNISHRLDKLAVLHSLGASVLLLDYRGYGASEGTPSEEGLYRGADATDLAARRPVGGLVLESAPTSIIEVARHHYPYVPVALLLSDRYDAASRVARVTAPILILHSPDDEIVPFAMAEELLAAARGQKRLVRLAGGHNDGFLVAATAYREALRTFLARRV